MLESVRFLSRGMSRKLARSAAASGSTAARTSHITVYRRAVAVASLTSNAARKHNSTFDPMAAAVGATALVASARRASAAAAFSTTAAICSSRPVSPPPTPPTASFVTLSFSGAGHLLPYHLGVASSLHRASTNGGGGKSNQDPAGTGSTNKSQLPHVPVSLPGTIRAVSGSSSGAVAATVLVRLPHRIEEYADAFLAEGGRAVAILKDMLHDEERRLVSVTSATASGEGDGTASEGRSRVEVLSPGQAAHHTTRRVGGGGGGRILNPPRKTGGATTKSNAPPPLPPSLHIATTRCDTGNLHLFDFRPVHAEFRTISASWTNDELLQAVEASCRIPRSFHPADVLESPFLGGMLGAFGGGGGGSASTYPDEDGVCINGRWYVDGGIAAPAPPTPLDRADGAIRVVISPISGGPLVEEAEGGDEMIRRGRRSHRISPPDESRRLLPFALRLRGGLSVFPSVQNLRALGISAGAASRNDLMRWYDAGREDGAKFLRDVRL